MNQKDQIQIEDLQKIDIRVGTVTFAVDNSAKGSAGKPIFLIPKESAINGDTVI